MKRKFELSSAIFWKAEACILYTISKVGALCSPFQMEKEIILLENYLHSLTNAHGAPQLHTKKMQPLGDSGTLLELQLQRHTHF